MQTDDAAGLDAASAARLAEWLRTAVPEIPVDGPIGVARISGGRSNLTYRITDADGGTWALRRPPMGMVLATAHDMGREWRFISALADTPVPVPPPVAFCADVEVIGAPFYLMRFVDGVVLNDPESGNLVAPAARPTVGTSLVDVLAALHAVEPEAVGLGDLRRDGNYLERQLRRWDKQVHESSLPDLSVIEAGHDLLVRRLADLPPADVRIVHGDYRAGNVAIGPDGTVRAVFDWELATIGDPLADLGWMMASWGRPGDAVAVSLPGPNLVGGYSDGDELVARYGAASGRDVGQIDFYVAFSRWRSACILAGVHSRYVGGAMGDTDEQGSDYRLAAIEQQAHGVLTDLG